MGLVLGRTNYRKMLIPYPYQSLELVGETETHWRFLCCFHKETEGSLTVNKNGQWPLYFRCWACGQSGSPEQFAVKYLGHDRKLANSQIKIDSDIKEIIRPKINWETLRGCPLSHIPDEEKRLAEAVGVSVRAVRLDSIGWKDYKFLIPMLDNYGICGIATRNYYGTRNECDKRCIRYSKHGWFGELNHLTSYLSPIFICEGWSDKAVLTELGFQAQGRFNASDLRINILWNRNKIYIVSDTDECGLKGSRKLQSIIGGKLIIPAGYKDIREMYLDRGRGETKQWLESQL